MTAPQKKKGKPSVLKILSRLLLLYPFCLLILYFAIFHFAAEGEIKLAVFGILIPGAFLVSDLILIYRQMKGKE